MSVGVALGVEGRGSCSSSEKVLPLHVHIPPSTQEGRWVKMIYAEEGNGSALSDSRKMKLICMLSSPKKIPHTGKTGSGTVTLSIQRGSKIKQTSKRMAFDQRTTWGRGQAFLVLEMGVGMYG